MTQKNRRDRKRRSMRSRTNLATVTYASKGPGVSTFVPPPQPPPPLVRQRGQVQLVPPSFPPPPPPLAENRQSQHPQVNHHHRVKHDAVFLSGLAYEPFDAAVQKAAQRGYRIDKQLSSDDTLVFLHEPSGRPMVVHRGSHTYQDYLVDDVMIALDKGDISPRHFKARRVTREVAEKYKDQEIDSVGHSLGGRLAQRSGATGHIITVNRAVGPRDAFHANRHADKIHHIRVEGDLVSVLGAHHSGTTTIPGPHPRRRFPWLGFLGYAADAVSGAGPAHSLSAVDLDALRPHAYD